MVIGFSLRMSTSAGSCVKYCCEVYIIQQLELEIRRHCIVISLSTWNHVVQQLESKKLRKFIDDAQWTKVHIAIN